MRDNFKLLRVRFSTVPQLVILKRGFNKQQKHKIMYGNQQFNEGWGLHNSQPKKAEHVVSSHKYTLKAQKGAEDPIKEGVTTFLRENKTITQKWVNGKCISVEEKLLRKPQRMLRK